MENNEKRTEMLKFVNMIAAIKVADYFNEHILEEEEIDGGDVLDAIASINYLFEADNQDIAACAYAIYSVEKRLHRNGENEKTSALGGSFDEAFMQFVMDCEDYQ